MSVRANQAGIKALLRDQDTLRMLTRLGRKVERAAKAAVPVESGDLRRSVTIRSELHGGTRWVVHVVAEQPYAAKVLATNPAFAASLDAART